ncbi:MAG: hypothetical protein ACRDYZ_06770 [Acidimicrobiales bacterium]
MAMTGTIRRRRRRLHRAVPPRPRPGTRPYGASLWLAVTVAVASLLVALYVAVAYLIDPGTVASVVLLCGGAGWFLVEGHHRRSAHRRARARAEAQARAREKGHVARRRVAGQAPAGGTVGGDGRADDERAA